MDHNPSLHTTIEQVDVTLDPLAEARRAIAVDIRRRTEKEALLAVENQHYSPPEFDQYDMKRTAMAVLLHHAETHPEDAIDTAKQIAEMYAQEEVRRIEQQRLEMEKQDLQFKNQEKQHDLMSMREKEKEDLLFKKDEAARIEKRNLLQWGVNIAIGVGLYIAGGIIALHGSPDTGIALIGAGTGVIVGKKLGKKEAKNDGVTTDN